MQLLKSKIQIFVTLVFIGFFIWWISFQPVVTGQGLSVQWFGATYGVIALFGAIIGFIAAHKWGGFKTVIGRSLTFFALSLLAQEAGQLIYTYYIYVSKIQIPYPSWGDAAYFSSVLLYIYAAILLAKAAGIKYAFKSAARYKAIAVLVPIIMLGIAYRVFLYHQQYNLHKPLTVFLDFGYPTGEAIYISLALTAFLLSRKLLGGVMRAGILIVILALAVQYFSDFTFLYMSNKGSWQTGHWNDLSYMIAYFVMTTAMIKFLLTYKGLRVKGKQDG